MSMAAVEEGAKKSSVLWLELPGGTRLAWHVWHEGAIYLVTGGAEQELPGLGEAEEIEVVLRSKDNGARLVRFPAKVEVIDQAEHADVVALLARERLNGSSETWATGSLVVKLTPQEMTPRHADDPVTRPGTAPRHDG